MRFGPSDHVKPRRWQTHPIRHGDRGATPATAPPPAPHSAGEKTIDSFSLAAAPRKSPATPGDRGRNGNGPGPTTLSTSPPANGADLRGRARAPPRPVWQSAGAAASTGCGACAERRGPSGPVPRRCRRSRWAASLAVAGRSRPAARVSSARPPRPPCAPGWHRLACGGAEACGRPWPRSNGPPVLAAAAGRFRRQGSGTLAGLCRALGSPRCRRFRNPAVPEEGGGAAGEVTSAR